MQLDKFTLKSQEAIQTAQQLAQTNGNQELQPEHLLKAILEQPDGVVVPVLQKMGVTPSVILNETNQLINNLPKVSGAGANQTYASQQLRSLLDQSFKTAANMQDEYVSQEHLFLTMLAERSLKVTAMLGRHGITAGQILVTLGDTEERRRYLNGRATIGKLLKLGAVPVINENDTVATTEIRYGDNDRLAARVAAMMSADLLVLLSDIDGLYTANPHTHPDAKLIPLVERITPEVLALADGAGSALGTGGMSTKLRAAQMVTAEGADMVIANGSHPELLYDIADGRPAGTRFAGRKEG